MANMRERVANAPGPRSANPSREAGFQTHVGGCYFHQWRYRLVHCTLDEPEQHYGRSWRRDQGFQRCWAGDGRFRDLPASVITVQVLLVCSTAVSGSRQHRKVCFDILTTTPSAARSSLAAFETRRRCGIMDAYPPSATATGIGTHPYGWVLVIFGPSIRSAAQISCRCHLSTQCQAADEQRRCCAASGDPRWRLCSGGDSEWWRG